MQTGPKVLGNTGLESKERRPDRIESSPPSSSGFAGRLDGATVADLVQLECAAGRTRAIKVQSQGRTGYLCFEQGQLVHAIAPGAVGDAAVLQILGWQEGAFEPARVRWPATASVRSSWQHLLLVAAHEADERARSKILEFPPGRSKQAERADEPVSRVADVGTFAGGGVAQPRAPVARQADAGSSTKVVAQMQDDGSLDLGLDEPVPLRRLITQAVRLDTAGRVLAARGDVEAFAGRVAYAKRLADLVGEALGAGKLRALKCTGRDAQTLVYEEESGTIVGLTAAVGSGLSALDGKLGL